MLGDTVWTISSPPGAAARGIVRMSGPRALAIAAGLLAAPVARRRGALEARLPMGGQGVRALVLVLPGPRTYTGEDLVELHVPGSPLLLATLGERLGALGARPALPGELTRRACESGRMS